MVAVCLAACIRPTDPPVETRFIVSPQIVASPKLLQIDSLMWHHPDSALIQLVYYFKPNGDTITISSRKEYDQRYAYLLLAELLFKNGYPQTCRENLLRTVDYFDSLLAVEICEANTRDVSLPFLAARAHYMKGVGYEEQDSVVSACTEYIHALEIMENHFPNVETCHGASLPIAHIPRFMMLIYCRLGDLFSDQYMQDLALVCFKKALCFYRLEPVIPTDYSNLLHFTGLQYDKMQQWDSALHYYDEALRQLPDTNNSLFRVLMSNKANLNYASGKGIEPAVSDLKRIATQSYSSEKPYHFFLIGQIYYDASQHDSALVYLAPAFEQSEDVEIKSLIAKYLHEIYQNKSDTLKAAQYAIYHAEHTEDERVSKARVSQLNELFQHYLREKREKSLFMERQKVQRRNLWIGLGIAFLLMMLGFWYALNHKHRKQQEAALQEEKLQQQEAFNQQLQEAQTALKEKEFEAVLKQVKELYADKQGQKRERIIGAFKAAYPEVYDKLKSKYTDLTQQECDLLVFNFLRFRIKEEAVLLGLSPNTVTKYRSDLSKKVGKDPIFDLL